MKTICLKNVNEVPNAAYEGYIWMVSSSEPKVLDGTSVVEISSFITGENPFIVEALLFDKALNITYHILHTHQYIITKFEIEDSDKNVRKNYLGHRIGDKKLAFDQIWVEEEDEYCNGFPTLKLKAQVFKGFTN